MFSVGDKVRCVDSSGLFIPPGEAWREPLVIGKIYTVRWCRRARYGTGGKLRLAGDLGMYDFWRFEKV